MKIAFYSPHLGLRGTEVAMYDYAYYNREVLGNESVILYQRDDPRNHQSAIEKFSKEFKVIPMYDFGYNMYDVKGSAPQTIQLLDKILIEEKCDGIFMSKGGHNDDIVPTSCRSLIHAIACVSPNEKHGDRYAFGSKWLSDYCSQGQIPSIPYIVDLPNIDDNLRTELGIPDNVIVFGRSGGPDTWNLPFASEAVVGIVNRRSDIIFLLQNTPVFYNHPQIIHIPSTSDMIYKTKFINTCDAMIHARHEGESFGLACGEFSLRNKPVITWYGSQERNHIEVLGDKGIYYNNKEELLDLLNNFKVDNSIDWNCYREFNPAAVMDIFKKTYLD